MEDWTVGLEGGSHSHPSPSHPSSLLAHVCWDDDTRSKSDISSSTAQAD